LPTLGLPMSVINPDLNKITNLLVFDYGNKLSLARSIVKC